MRADVEARRSDGSSVSFLRLERSLVKGDEIGAGMSGTHESHAGNGEQAAALSNVVVRLIREYTGRGPTRAHTHMGENLVTVVLRDSLTKGELSLVRDGLSDTVLKTRKAYQGTMRRELVAEVERITGRTVEAFLSDNHIDPDVGIEVFMLEAAQAPGSR